MNKKHKIVPLGRPEEIGEVDNWQKVETCTIGDIIVDTFVTQKNIPLYHVDNETLRRLHPKLFAQIFHPHLMGIVGIGEPVQEAQHKINHEINHEIAGDLPSMSRVDKKEQATEPTAGTEDENEDGNEDGNDSPTKKEADESLSHKTGQEAISPITNHDHYLIPHEQSECDHPPTQFEGGQKQHQPRNEHEKRTSLWEKLSGEEKQIGPRKSKIMTIKYFARVLRQGKKKVKPEINKTNKASKIIGSITRVGREEPEKISDKKWKKWLRSNGWIEGETPHGVSGEGEIMLVEYYRHMAPEINKIPQLFYFGVFEDKWQKGAIGITVALRWWIDFYNTIPKEQLPSLWRQALKEGWAENLTEINHSDFEFIINPGTTEYIERTMCSWGYAHFPKNSPWKKVWE